MLACGKVAAPRPIPNQRKMSKERGKGDPWRLSSGLIMPILATVPATALCYHRVSYSPLAKAVRRDARKALIALKLTRIVVHSSPADIRGKTGFSALVLTVPCLLSFFVFSASAQTPRPVGFFLAWSLVWTLNRRAPRSALPSGIAVFD